MSQQVLRDTIAGVLDADALGAVPRGTPYEQADRIIAALPAVQATLAEQLQTLTRAAVALAVSEVGVASLLRGDGAAGSYDTFDDWPEMDALLTALDAVQPGWRALAPEAAHG